jgi:uncharacterized protein
MRKLVIINQTKNHVEQLLKNDSSGHDWWHVYRVWKLAKHIAKQEKQADLFIIELGALLHDIADWKFNDGDDKKGIKIARDWLETLNVSEKDIQDICHIIEHISFKGAGETNRMESIEGLIIQDADRLDALGAIGIARTFAYGGYKGRPIYDPTIKPILHQSFEAYKQSNTPSLNHFYEKLFLLKDRMNTQTGKQLAEKRHIFMETYVKEFYKEWEGIL